MRIVIVPGHEDTESGGVDPGAIGPTGLQEEDVVEAVAREMRELAPPGALEFKRQPPRGHSVLLATLRRNPPDVVVALHCNAPARDRHEARVYWDRRDDDENRREGSLALADAIANALRGVAAENAFVKSFPISRRGRDGQAREFTPGIFSGTATRAVVLVELGFISDPHVEAAMRTESWRQRAAGALLSAIEAWGGPLT